MSNNVFQQHLDAFYRHAFTAQSRLYPDGTNCFVDDGMPAHSPFAPSPARARSHTISPDHDMHGCRIDLRKEFGQQ